MEPIAFRAAARSSSGEPCEPSLTGEELSRLLCSALFPSGGGQVELEENVHGALLVRATASDLAQTQELRDRVLSGEFDEAVAVALGADSAWSLHADRTEFAEHYEERALAFRELTPHQREKLEECAGGDAVHLRAPAGAGKTFVALQRVLELLLAEPEAHALFITRNAALGCFAASWLGRRAKGAQQRRSLLGRLHVLHEPLVQGARAVAVRGGRVELLASTVKPARYELAVVDEAHHLYTDPTARDLVEEIATSAHHRLLLSDVSQSLGRGVVYPEGLREVVLSEVVRCSRRIVAGAMAFQLGGEEKLLTKCHHEATGPPLQSFLFDLPPGKDVFDDYAEHVVRAVQHVIQAFPGLSLHNRLALLVPDVEFLSGLQPKLSSALAECFPERNLRLVDAAVASSELGREAAAEEAAEGGDMSMAEEEEWLLFDTIHEVDGLERLIVIGIGLDSAIREDSAEVAASPAALQARSRLYRAVTRAHLMFLVVNEFLRGGWLEFLASVRLRRDEAFDSSAELARSELQAVEGVVLAEIASALTTRARERGLSLEEQVVTMLATAVAAKRERGKPLEPALDEALSSWSFGLEQVTAALRSAAEQLAVSLPCGAALAELKAPLALGYYSNQLGKLGNAALDALRRWRDTELHGRVDAALKVCNTALSCKVVVELRARVLVALEQGSELEQAASAAVQDWLQAERQVAEALRDEVDWLPEGSPELREGLEAAAVAVTCNGEDLECAVQNAVERLERKRAEREAGTAVERAAAAEEPLCCRAGCRVRIVGLERRPVLNGKEGLAVRFNAASSRWAVQLDGQDAPLGARPENLKPLHQTPPPSPLLAAAALLRARVARGEEVEQVVLRWRTLEAQVASALQARTSGESVNSEDMAELVRTVAERLWDSDKDLRMAACISEALADWEQRKRVVQQEAAEIAAALEAAVNAQRLMVSDAAMENLRVRVVAALRRGEELQEAVASVLREYHREVVRRQVQQTIWDPSNNATRKATGVLRFMPFKQRGSEGLLYGLLEGVFAMLPFARLAELARVCKRWHGVATDPSWKPELVAYAWGAAEYTGLAKACPQPTLLEFSLAKRIVRIACSDFATLALTEEGTVWFWGSSWLKDTVPDQPEPTQLKELRDIVSVTTSPAGYFHGRRLRRGYACAAVARDGSLFTWGLNNYDQLLQPGGHTTSPTRVRGDDWEEWAPERERVLHAALGLDFLALCVQREGQEPAVLSCGCFCTITQRTPHDLREWPELRGVALRQLVAGGFHCLALTTRGDVFSFGDTRGQDSSNGNLLGLGLETPQLGRNLPPHLARAGPPQRIEDLGGVAEVACSSYSSIAITAEGRVYSWGDCDGGALGHSNRTCHTPTQVQALQWQRAAHGSLAYTNGAVATSEGRVFVWGGNCWEGGIAEDRGSALPSEVEWRGVPPCYRCASVALAHRHGYLIFRKQL